MALGSELLSGLNDQADHVQKNGAPGTASICRALAEVARGNTKCGNRIAAWPPDKILSDAMPLRIAGGLHALFRRGLEPRLGDIYSGKLADQPSVGALICEIVERHDTALLSWFDSPPQTNEAGRSASLVAALHWLAVRLPPCFELNEIGSSAGLNLLIDRYRFDLGGVISGPTRTPVTITPTWIGPRPPASAFTIASVQGCDTRPIDVNDTAAASRLMAYIWPEAPERFRRLEAGIRMIQDEPVKLVELDASDFVASRLAAAQEPGTTRVLMHSIVWQYLPVDAQRRIEHQMENAGCGATRETALAWISLETNRLTFNHELIARFWPGSGTPIKLGEAHAHGKWVKWFGA